MWIKELNKTYFQLLLLKSKPEDIPYSKILLGVMLVIVFSVKNLANFGFSFLLKEYAQKASEKVNLSILDSIEIVFVSLLIMMAFIYILLCFYNKRNRLVQTTTAVLALDLNLTILFMVWMVIFTITPLAILFFILLLYWQFVVLIHIFSNAVDANLLEGGIFALLYMLLQHNVAEFLMNSMLLN